MAKETTAKTDKKEKRAKKMAAANAQANAKKKNKKKKNFFARLWQSIKDLRSEMKKVVWPTKKQLFNNTVVVIITMAVVGAFIWLLDWGLGTVISLIIGS